MIYLGLGSNLNSKYGNRFDNINFAISQIGESGISINKKSSFYETPSCPNSKNPKFINIVISIKTSLTPKDLMTFLISLEEKMGRKRSKKNDPRICDIDIIDYNNQVLDLNYVNFNLKIPHKQMISRNFVLFPLKEISPGWKHPKTNEIIMDLIEKLSNEQKNSILKIDKY